MVTISLYLDTRRMKDDGTYPVKIRIGTKMVSTGMSAHPDEWVNGQFTKRAKNYAAKNATLNRWLAELGARQLTEDLKDKELVALANEMIKGVPAAEKKKCFVDYLDEYVSAKRLSEGTKGIYATTRNKLEQYQSGVNLDEIDKNWLTGFESWMAGTMKVNAYAIHLRNIRSVFNYCLDEEYTTQYPFRKFSIKSEETEKRCLTVEQVRHLRDYPVEEFQEIYRDMWMLMFYMIGINAADLFLAKKSQVQNGRLVYKRSKTGTLYSIKIQPEAQEIIDRYSGKGEYLLRVMDVYANYKDFLHRMNLNLRRFGSYERKGRGGKKIIEKEFDNLSSYWSRHTWATIAAELDIPIEVISHALGHKIGSEVTSIYIQFNRKKVDEANRKLIDYVNKKEG